MVLLPILVSDRGSIITLTYQGLLDFHGSSALAGITLGYRVMQAASDSLAQSRKPIERNHLSIVSGHPGPGYRDAFEYVTHRISRDRFQVNRTLPGGRHSPYQNYAFQFHIKNKKQQATVTLREGFMPQYFFEVLRDLKTDPDNQALITKLGKIKSKIAYMIAQQRLSDLFDIRISKFAN